MPFQEIKIMGGTCCLTMCQKRLVNEVATSQGPTSRSISSLTNKWHDTLEYLCYLRGMETLPSLSQCPMNNNKTELV